MGSYESRSVERDPTTAILFFGCRPTQSDFIEAYESTTRYMQMVLAHIPSQTTSTGLQAIGFQSAKHRQWASSFLGISAPALQEEAHRLLLGQTVQHQSVNDLAMASKGPQANVTKAVPKITQFFTPDTPASELRSESQVEVERGSSDLQVPGPLEKPTTAHLDEYRRVSLFLVRI